MKIYRECSLTDFEPWSGGADRYNVLTYEQLEQLEPIFEELFPNGASETEINDTFWFEDDTIAEWLGFSDWEALERYNNGEEEEEEEEEEKEN